MRPATAAELANWDRLVIANPDGGQILQSRAWGEFKSRHGWVSHHLVDEGTSGTVAILALSRRIPGLGELWYAPKGPGIADAAALPGMLRDVRSFRNAFTIRVEPEVPAGADLGAWPAGGLVKAPRDVQISRATILLDIRPGEERLLASFKPKCRYNIRLAARRGVVVRALPAEGAAADAMFRLLAAAGSRGGFAVRPREYYLEYWRLQAERGQGQLFLAVLGDEVLAGAFVTRLGRRAWYKDGGSVKRHSELMAPHLLQWEVIRWLRSRGVECYDLVAVPRPDELSPEHPLHGLYRFKSGFSDRITEFVGAWDRPLRWGAYALWTRAGERAAQRWAARVRHDLFY